MSQRPDSAAGAQSAARWTVAHRYWHWHSVVAISGRLSRSRFPARGAGDPGNAQGAAPYGVLGLCAWGVSAVANRADSSSWCRPATAHRRRCPGRNGRGCFPAVGLGLRLSRVAQPVDQLHTSCHTASSITRRFAHQHAQQRGGGGQSPAMKAWQSRCRPSATH